ncbi:hypothetical protein TSUD_151950 [Trifolium subterraneum]|uniref:Uncharacterized protein n=1 Tax=Trifolium subterraneum TaxID=3900 RepID=A0A2Z6MNR9_TRISU|nr:hypothetical protein TSUD_151950 [Trifolium subterraneum]
MGGDEAKPSAVRFMVTAVIWTAVFMSCKTINPNPFTVNKTALQLLSCQKRRDTWPNFVFVLTLDL